MTQNQRLTPAEEFEFVGVAAAPQPDNFMGIIMLNKDRMD
jgi:hypothetical protein